MKRAAGPSRDPRIRLLLALLDESFERKAWQGPNLRGALRGVRAAEAAWRPAPGSHNIWELVLHVAYWEYAAARRLTGERRGAFAIPGTNFFRRPVSPTEKAWRADLVVLDEAHRRLRAAVAALPPRSLERRPPGSRYTAATIVYGAASHNVYHTGQIQLLKSQRRNRGR
ncbi:MAG TPA: DinB family protein [Thermoanaerobaculia bacterium]|jgi:uncharacterized damage-inducible protein DinB